MRLTAVILGALLRLAVLRGENTLTNYRNLSQEEEGSLVAPWTKSTWEENINGFAKLPVRGELFLKCYEYEDAEEQKKCRKLERHTVDVTNTTIEASCGGTYQVNEGGVVVVKLPSASPTCDMILTADHNAQVDVRCSRFRLGPRQRELLFITPGDTLGWVYDKHQRPRIMDLQQPELYLLYTRRRATAPSKSDVTCLVEAADSKPSQEEKGPLRKAKGRQIKGCNTECGLSSMRDMRVVGGTEVDKTEIPWMAHISLKKANDRYSLCGGSILTDTLILTAAHCLSTVVSATVFVGMRDRRNKRDTQIIPVWGVIVHPHYDPGKKLHDIALLVLAEEIVWTEYVRPICLAPRRVVQEGGLVVVSGWGRTKPYRRGQPSVGEGSQVLLKALVSVVPERQCKKMYPGLITKYHLCAAAPGKDSCQGDSGGPLVVRDKNIWYQAGIVSTGYGCADPNYAGVNTRVSEYAKWILNHTTGSCYRGA